MLQRFKLLTTSLALALSMASYGLALAAPTPLDTDPATENITANTTLDADGVRHFKAGEYSATDTGDHSTSPPNQLLEYPSGRGPRGGIIR